MPVLVGQPNTGKSLLGKIVGSLLGLHKAARYTELSTAFMENALSQSLWFIYDDPDDMKSAKSLITKVGDFSTIIIIVIIIIMLI